MRRKAIFREVFNASLGYELSTRVSWTLERRALRHYQATRSLWNIPGVEEEDQHKHSHIIGVYSSEDGVLTAAVGSNGTIRVHEPSDMEDSFRVDLKAPNSIAATWGIDDRLYIALAYRAKIWRFDLESCETDKPTQQLVLPEHDRGTAAPGLSDMTTLDANTLAVTMSNGMAFVLDDRLKRSAVSEVRVTNDIGSAKPAAITASNPLIITGARGCLTVFDIRRLPPATYGNALTNMRTLGGGGGGGGTPASSYTSSNIVTSLRVTQSASDFGTIHVAPGSKSRIAFQLASGHVGIGDLLSNSGNTQVKIELATPRLASSSTSAGDLELMDYGASLTRVTADTWWVHRRRCSISAMRNGVGWRFFAPLVHENGFRVVAMHTNAPTRVHTVKTSNRVTSVCALGQYGGCASLAVGYSRLGVDLFQSEMRNSNTVEENSR